MDKGECELGGPLCLISLNATLASIKVLIIGFVHQDTPNELHFHRLEDMESKKVKEFIQEDRVVSPLLSLPGCRAEPLFFGRRSGCDQNLISETLEAGLYFSGRSVSTSTCASRWGKKGGLGWFT